MKALLAPGAVARHACAGLGLALAALSLAEIARLKKERNAFFLVTFLSVSKLTFWKRSWGTSPRTMGSMVETFPNRTSGM